MRYIGALAVLLLFGAQGVAAFFLRQVLSAPLSSSAKKFYPLSSPFMTAESSAGNVAYGDVAGGERGLFCRRDVLGFATTTFGAATAAAAVSAAPGSAFAAVTASPAAHVVLCDNDDEFDAEALCVVPITNQDTLDRKKARPGTLTAIVYVRDATTRDPESVENDDDGEVEVVRVGDQAALDHMNYASNQGEVRCYNFDCCYVNKRAVSETEWEKLFPNRGAIAYPFAGFYLGGTIKDKQPSDGCTKDNFLVGLKKAPKTYC